MLCLSRESPGTARLVLVLTGKRAHSVRGIRAPNPSHTQGSELELQDLRRFRPTAQQTWRRDWPERRSRDCDVTSSNENSLKKLIHYGDWDDTPLGTPGLSPRESGDDASLGIEVGGDERCLRSRTLTGELGAARIVRGQ